jgi:hypothetical protein
VAVGKNREETRKRTTSLQGFDALRHRSKQLQVSSVSNARRTAVAFTAPQNHSSGRRTPARSAVIHFDASINEQTAKYWSSVDLDSAFVAVFAELRPAVSLYARKCVEQELPRVKLYDLHKDGPVVLKLRASPCNQSVVLAVGSRRPRR